MKINDIVTNMYYIYVLFCYEYVLWVSNKLNRYFLRRIWNTISFGKSSKYIHIWSITFRKHTVLLGSRILIMRKFVINKDKRTVRAISNILKKLYILMNTNVLYIYIFYLLFSFSFSFSLFSLYFLSSHLLLFFFFNFSANELIILRRYR